MLFNWKIKDTGLCNYCPQIDTLEHHLYDCSVSKIFWKDLSNWLFINLDVRFNFAKCEILLGFLGSDEQILNGINLLILLGKWFIHKEKSESKPIISFNIFLNIVKRKLLA